MFRKPFHVKRLELTKIIVIQNLLKIRNLLQLSLIKKILRRKVIARVPDDIGKQFTSSQQFCIQRIQTSVSVWLNVYTCEKCPLFFEIDGNSVLFPTVYLLSLSSQSYPVLFVNNYAFERLENGADLMLPGVIIDENFRLPLIATGLPVAIAMITDKGIKGPVAVGKALMSSEEMLTAGMKGRGIQILHTYRDLLWESGSKASIPCYSHENFFALIFKPENNVAGVDDTVIKTLESTSVTNLDCNEQSIDHSANALNNDHLGPDRNEVDDIYSVDKEQKVIDEMENLLCQTFLAAVRYKVDGNCTFPIDAGQFYANFVLKNISHGQRIDLKKTKYKKFSNFLRKINEELADTNSVDWIVKIVSKKGVDSIEELNFNHPAVKSAEFPVFDSTLECGVASALTIGVKENKTSRIKVSECYSVTEAVISLFRRVSPTIRRGDVLQQNKIRDLVLEYAKSEKLEIDGNKIVLDDTLQSIVKYFLPDVFPLNDVVQKIYAQMTKCCVVSTEDGTWQKVFKGKLPSIEFKVEKRSGNKMVTLLNNVTSFGVDEKYLCQRIQSAMATGTSITATASNCEGPQILAHGNMVNFIADELMNTYGIQKKFFKGLEFGAKEKKKKK